MATRKAPAPKPEEQPITTPQPAPGSTLASDQGELGEYEVDGPGGPITVLLTEAEAKARNAKAFSPRNKAQSPANK